jgi:alkylhydroperoxidase/carboxymuconolactone decarboxylase family protein YurZ
LLSATLRLLMRSDQVDLSAMLAKARGAANSAIVGTITVGAAVGGSTAAIKAAACSGKSDQDERRG